MSGTVQTAVVRGYDPMGRITNLWQCTPYNCGSSAWAMTYTYDLAGDITQYTHPGNFTVYEPVNTAKEHTSLTWGSNVAVDSLSYEPWGALSTICGGASCADSQETRGYNKRLQPALMELGNSGNPTADYCLVYNYYQGAGNPSSCVVPAPASSGDDGTVAGSWFQDNVNTGYSRTVSYSYDGVNRLTQATAKDLNSNTL